MRKMAISCVAIFVAAAPAFGELGFKQDRDHQTTELSGLSSDSRCGKNLVSFSGKIVKRDIDRDELTVTRFVVESADGTRRVIGIIFPDYRGNFPYQVVQSGLHRLTKPGRMVSGRVLVCGPGRIETLEEIH